MRYVQTPRHSAPVARRWAVSVILVFAVAATTCLLWGIGGGVLFGKLVLPRLGYVEQDERLTPDRGREPELMREVPVPNETTIPQPGSTAPMAVLPTPVTSPVSPLGEEPPAAAAANHVNPGPESDGSPEGVETTGPRNALEEDASWAANVMAGLPAKAPTTPATRLVIPSLAVDAPVVLLPLRDGTWDVSHLTQEIGHLQGTASPGENSNVALAGHITLVQGGDGPFKDLAQLKAGDGVLVYAGAASFRYAVERVYVVDPTAVEITFPSHRPLLTLITCANWDDSAHKYVDRVAAIAHLVE